MIVVCVRQEEWWTFLDLQWWTESGARIVFSSFLMLALSEAGSAVL